MPSHNLRMIRPRQGSLNLFHPLSLTVWPEHVQSFRNWVFFLCPPNSFFSCLFLTQLSLQLASWRVISGPDIPAAPCRVPTESASPSWNPNPHLPIPPLSFRRIVQNRFIVRPTSSGAGGLFRWRILQRRRISPDLSCNIVQNRAAIVRIELQPIYIRESDFPSDNVALFRSLYSQKCNEGQRNMSKQLPSNYSEYHNLFHFLSEFINYMIHIQSYFVSGFIASSPRLSSPPATHCKLTCICSGPRELEGG